MKKNKNVNDSKCLDLNQVWNIASCHYELYNDSDNFYYFDTDEYTFLLKRFQTTEKQKEIVEQEGTRYIKLFQYITQSQYKSMLTILGNKNVSNWFSASKNEIEKYVKYDVFLDWNNLYSDERYRLYETVIPMLIDWCDKNNIKYKFIPLSKPKNYIYSDISKLKSCDWEMPEVEFSGNQVMVNQGKVLRAISNQLEDGSLCFRK